MISSLQTGGEETVEAAVVRKSAEEALRIDEFASRFRQERSRIGENELRMLRQKGLHDLLILGLRDRTRCIDEGTTWPHSQ